MDDILAKISAAKARATADSEAAIFYAMVWACIESATVIDERVEPLMKRVAELEAKVSDLEAERAQREEFNRASAVVLRGAGALPPDPDGVDTFGRPLGGTA